LKANNGILGQTLVSQNNAISLTFYMEMGIIDRDYKNVGRYRPILSDIFEFRSNFNLILGQLNGKMR
jgi:hypothetical protein